MEGYFTSLYVCQSYNNHLDSSLPCLFMKLSETSIFCRDIIKLSSTSSDMFNELIMDLNSIFGRDKGGLEMISDAELADIQDRYLQVQIDSLQFIHS